MQDNTFSFLPNKISKDFSTISTPNQFAQRSQSNFQIRQKSKTELLLAKVNKVCQELIETSYLNELEDVQNLLEKLQNILFMVPNLASILARVANAL